MEQRHKGLLLAKRLEITSDLRFRNIRRHLIDHGILNGADLDEIENHESREDQVKALLDVLPTRGSNAFTVFRDALKDRYPHLARILKDELPTEPRVFIIHAGEDKEPFVRPLVTKLQQKGLAEKDIFFDDVSIKPGDVIRERILSTLSSQTLELAVIVVSTSFLNKPYWPKLEYETCLKNRKRIFPIWVDTNIDKFKAFSELVGKYSPTLKQLSARRVQRDNVAEELPNIATEVVQRLSTLETDVPEPTAIQTLLCLSPSPFPTDSGSSDEDDSIKDQDTCSAGVTDEQQIEDKLKDEKEKHIELLGKVGRNQLQLLKDAESLLPKEIVERMTQDMLDNHYQYSLHILKVKMGCAIVHLVPDNLAALDMLWRDYKSGQLSIHFSDYLITDEMRKVVGKDLMVRVIMLEEQYRQWKRYFQETDNVTEKMANQGVDTDIPWVIPGKTTEADSASATGQVKNIGSADEKEPERKEKTDAPLHWAARGGHRGVVSALLETGVGVNSLDAKERTPLHEAVVNGQHETVQALLLAGADVNARDIARITPLHDAATQGHCETIRALLVAFADVNAKDLEQNTPLHLAAGNGNNEAVKALLKAGGDVNARDAEQRTPLHLAARNDNHETARALLMSHGVAVNAFTNQQWTPLHLAAMKGHHKTASVLLTANADVNAQDKEQKTPLHLAAWNGDCKTVSVLLVAGADVNVQDKWRNTPIREAEKQGNSKCVETLLQADDGNSNKGPSKKRGFDPVLINFYEQRGMTTASGKDPLVQEAAKQTGKSVDQVKNFISNYRRSKKDRKRKLPADDSGSTVVKKSSPTGEMTNIMESEPASHSVASASWQGLNIATATDQYEMKGKATGTVKERKKKKRKERERKEKQFVGDYGRSKGKSKRKPPADDSGITVKKESTSTDTTVETESTSTDIAVEKSTSPGQSTMADLPSHAAPSSPIPMLNTGSFKEMERKEEALREAAGTGQTTRVLQLLAEGIDPNTAGGRLQRTPLHLSAENGHHETVSALLNGGADIGTVDKGLRTSLHLAAQNGQLKSLSALLAANADVNARNDKLRTPMHLAAMNGHHETVTALHTAGADVNIWDDELSSPLHLAAQNGHHVTVSALLKAGADVNVFNNENITPLHMATMVGDHETVSVLLKYGADVTARDKQQITPLHMAARVGDLETVSVLLKSGADVTARDNQGHTPLEDAEQRGHRECVKKLQQGGDDKNEEAPRQKKGFDPVLVQFYEERGMTSASTKDPKVHEAAKKTGKTVSEVLNFIGNYRKKIGGTRPRPPADNAGARSIQRKKQALRPAFDDAKKKNKKPRFQVQGAKVTLVVEGKAFKTAESYSKYFA